MTPRALADALISHAAGLTGNAAAAELICAHHTWLTKADFVTSYIRTGTRHGDPQIVSACYRATPVPGPLPSTDFRQRP